MQGIFLREYIEERASTVHKDVTERLEVINPGLAGEIRKVLDVNKAERHLRGGMATREKYSHIRK